MKTKLFAVLLSATMGVTGSIWLIQSGFLGSLTPHDLASDMTESKAVHQPAVNERRCVEVQDNMHFQRDGNLFIDLVQELPEALRPMRSLGCVAQAPDLPLESGDH